MDQQQNQVQQQKAQIEDQLLARMQKQLEQGGLKAVQAKQIARLILDKLAQVHSFIELHLILPELETELGEVGQAVTPLLEKYNEQLKNSLWNTIESLASERKIKKLHKLVINLMNES